MRPTTLTLHSGFPIGEVDPRLFGGFLEHLGRAVYQGVYDPESSHADADGFRRDVLDALRGLDMTVMRYPGGNFVSGYHWEDGIGPRERRPRVLDLAWNSVETNAVGTDEFVRLCRKQGWTPMLAVNLGTGTPEEARNWVEYCNAPTGTRYAELRRAGGAREPHAVGLWCLGNEMDGPWQLGHVPAGHYGLRAHQAAKLMKAVDRSIQTVVCGSSSTLLDTYLEWDRVVMETVGGLADYVSLHRYVQKPQDDTAEFLAVTNSIDRQIEELDALCRWVQGRRRSAKRIFLCFDEWNVWYRTMRGEQMDGERRVAPPLLEEVYSLEDALVVAGFLHSFVRHADCVKIANLAQVTNVIAPLLTRGDELLVQSIYHPFAMFSKRRTGRSLRPSVQGPTYASERHGEVQTVDLSAILDGRELKVFATNRSLDCEAPLQVVLADRDITALRSADLLSGPDASSANSFDAPDVVRARPFDAVEVRGGRAHVALPPLSLLAMTLEVEAGGA